MGIAFQQKRIIGTITVRCECFMTIKTKFGTAYLNSKGYWELNGGKPLHKAIYEDHYKCCILKGNVIHHINEDKTDNRISNLRLMTLGQHTTLHNTNRTYSEETRRKLSESLRGKNHPNWGTHRSEETKKRISEGNIGKKHSEESMMKMSKSHNKTGYYRVSKRKTSHAKQGFLWTYSHYTEKGPRHITSVDINKLKEKVLAKGLEWIELKEVEECYT